jgi:uncharacterized RDD family membrane protein YckC
MEKASRLARLAATFIDGLIFGIPFIPSYVLAGHTLLHQGRISGVDAWMALAATGIMFNLALVADCVLVGLAAVLVHRNGQSIGKALLGIKVVRSDGGRATLGRIFWLRYFFNTCLTVIPFVGGLYALVDVLMIFGAERRCCHDHIADTIVVRA